MGKQRRSHFWASYADLMTSLFFFILILFIISLSQLKDIGLTPSEVTSLRTERDSLVALNSRIVHRQKKYEVALDSIQYVANATQSQIDKINEINDATKNLDQNYFVYDSIHKKHKLNFDIQFTINDDNIENIPEFDRTLLLSVGEELKNFIDAAAINTPEVQYLLVIEGQASRNGIDKMTYNYDLSYRRARNLKIFWDAHNIHFENHNCEVLICGSGDGRLTGTGIMRELNEISNQRFLIHILPKPGKIH